MDNKERIIDSLYHIISVLMLFAFLANMLPSSIYSYAENGDAKYDAIPISSEGQEGACVSAIDYDEVFVDSDNWQGIANFSVVKVPVNTTTIKWCDSEAEQYFKPTDYEFEPAGNRLDDVWWSINTEDLVECDTIQDKPFSVFLALKGSEGYCKEATYYELFDTPAPRDAGLRHFFIQVGDENSPLDVYAGTKDMIGADYWLNNSFSGSAKIELLLGVGKRHELFNDTDQVIWYTTDGSDPTNSSTSEKFSGPNPIVLTKSCIVKAAAKTPEDKWGQVSTFTCNVACSAPEITPKEGTYYEPFEATISCGTEGAKIYYTIDGSDPIDDDANLIGGAIEYDGPIAISKDTILKSVAIYNNIASEIITATYNLSAALKVDFYDDNQGVWLLEDTFINEREGRIVVPYNHSKCKMIATIKDGASLKLGSQVINPDEDGNYILNLDVKQNAELDDILGQENVITVTNEGENITYKIYCIASLYDDLPDKIDDYFVLASQYTNNGTIGCAPNTTLIGKVGNVFQCSSLGGFGGYIVWKYEEGIKNDPKNPYGVDFIVFGNSFDGTNEAAEPGNILVSENGTDWYILAGSIHYDANAVWNQEVTYTNKEGLIGYAFEGLESDTPAGLFDMPSGIARFPYPDISNYPLHEDNKDSFTTNGTLLVPEKTKNINIRPPYPAFGYADTGLMLSGSNEAENPYNGLIRDLSYPDRVKTNRNGDACDISWAVDEDGNPVQLDEIHFVKVQTASFIDGGSIGEKSTEVCCMRVAKAAESAVGITSAPASIKIDGTEVALKPGEIVDATVDGIFDIAVDAPETANVYINSLRSHTAFMDKAPHGIVRVIVQEGEKEPLIYYFNIDQNAQQTSKKVTAVTFDTGKGLMQDKEKLTCYFDADTIEHLGVDGEVAFPKAVSPKGNEGFAYWYNEDNEKQYAAYNADNAAKLNDKTLTAVYGKADDVEAASAVAKAIENLPDADKLTVEDDADDVKAAQDAYDALTEDQKKLISDENKTKLALASATIGKLEAEATADDLQKQLKKAQEDLRDAQDSVDELQGTVRDLQGQLKDAQDAVTEAQNKYDTLKAESDVDKHALKKAEDDLKAANELVEGLQTQLTTAQTDLAATQGKVTELQGKVNSLEKDLADEKAKAEAAQGDADKYEEELATLKAQNAILKKTVKKVKAKAKKKSALVSWKSVGKGFKYEVYRSTNPTKSFKKVKTAKQLKVTVKKLKKGKTYYFKVRAFKKVGGKKVYTGYSNIAKVKIKK